jgi:heptosyltransferase-2
MQREPVVVLLAPNWLGDAVMALPAMADVKRHVGAGRVVVAARPAVAPLYSMAPCIDDVVPLQSRRPLVARGDRASDLRRLQEISAATAIIFPNSFASAWIIRRAGIAERWGYASDLRGRLLTRRVRRPRRSMHQGAYYQHLVRELGIANGSLEPQLDVPSDVSLAARALLTAHGWDGARRLVVVAPGAAYGTAKRWLPEHFARLVRRLADEREAACVLVGSAGDRETAAWVKRSIRGTAGEAVIDLTGATTLPTLAGVMSLAAACVSNDSGAMHLAGAVGVPLAALFGPTREYETAPLMRAGAPAEVLINTVWCRPCMLRECPIDHRCMKGLSPDRVYDAIDRLMGSCDGRP